MGGMPPDPGRNSHFIFSLVIPGSSLSSQAWTLLRQAWPLSHLWLISSVFFLRNEKVYSTIQKYRYSNKMIKHSVRTYRWFRTGMVYLKHVI